MRKINIFFLSITLLCCININAQSIISTCGYTVSISYNPTEIVPFSLSCPWGYNFNVKFNYLITVQGINTCYNGNIEIAPSLTCSSIENVYWTLYVPAPIVGAPYSTINYSGTATTTTGLYNASTNCASATPINTGCTGCASGVVGPGLTTGNYGCSFVAGLPIELISFTGKSNNKSVLLNWTTISEINNDFFTIERSQDAIDFTEIGRSDGSGNSSRTINYSFIDSEPLIGTSYYRLKQTDFDGQFKYSNMINVMCKQKEEEIIIYPNPNNGRFILQGTELNTDLTILNALGEKVLIQKIATKNTEIDLSNFSNGIYFIHLGSAKESITQKFIINQ